MRRRRGLVALRTSRSENNAPHATRLNIGRFGAVNFWNLESCRKGGLGFVYAGMMALEVKRVQSDDHLIREVLGGHRDAYADLVRRYERQVHAIAWAIVRDHHIAQDVAQDTFIKAYDGLATLRTPRTFGAWLLTIVRRTAIDRARSKTPLVFVSTFPDIPIFDEPAENDAAVILTALAWLPAHEQQVILLRYFDGLAVGDIASLLGCPVGTVTKQLSRALTRLRERLKEKP